MQQVAATAADVQLELTKPRDVDLAGKIVDRLGRDVASPGAARSPVLAACVQLGLSGPHPPRRRPSRPHFNGPR